MYADTVSIIDYINNLSNKDNNIILSNDISKSIYTLLFVVKHMIDELKNLPNNITI